MPKKTRKLAFSTEGRPELWHTLHIDLGEDEPYEVRVKYWILTKPELDARRADETKTILDQAKASQAEDADGSELDRQIAMLERVVESISPEKGAERVEELTQRVLDWDLIDAASDTGEKLPCTPETVAKVCEYEAIFQALAAGLLAASGDARKKS